MDYEKKYNEALERAKRWAEGTLSPERTTPKGVCETIFPELRESEDERIRKRLITLIRVLDSLFFTGNNPSKEQCLAYLEKQKEQKSKEPGYKHEDYFCERCQANAFNAGRESVQKEQKPAEWNEEDERIRKAILGFLNPDKGGTKYSSYAELVKWSDWLKSLRPVSKESLQSHWKPSEEQMDSLRDTIVQTKGYSYSVYLPELYEQLQKLI